MKARIKHLGGADHWTHPETGAKLKVGDEHEADAHVQALVDDGWAEPLDAPPAASDAAPEQADGAGDGDAPGEGQDGDQGDGEGTGDGEAEADGEGGHKAAKGRKKNRG